MARMSALVVADGAPAPPQLETALVGGGFDVRHTTPASLAGRPDLEATPSVVLVSASLGLQQVARLGQRFSHAATPPTIIVFPQEDFAALEACVQGGFDYVMPPFLPGLLSSRMSSCRQRGQLALAVEEMAGEARLREYERDLSIAHDIQAGFLPERLPTPRGWELASRFRPAKQVGGDFYDGFELVEGRGLGFLVADVCDKGVGAALFMALIRTLLRHTAEHTDEWRPSGDAPGAAAGWAGQPASPPPQPLSIGAEPLMQAVVGTNRYLARNHLRQGYFATLFFGVLDPSSGDLLYINGGHNPPVLMRTGGGRALLRPTGPAVGMMPHSSYSLERASMAPGDTLLLYTDGVVEARAVDGGLFGLDRLLDTIVGPAGSAESLLAKVDGALQRHVGAAEPSDDITMMALRRAWVVP